MGSAEKVSWKRVLILAGAIIAFTIGSGFATGQEIIQYYTAYGVKGLLVILVFLVAFLYYNFNFAKAGAEQKFEKGNGRRSILYTSSGIWTSGMGRRSRSDSTGSAYSCRWTELHG